MATPCAGPASPRPSRFFRSFMRAALPFRSRRKYSLARRTWRRADDVDLVDDRRVQREDALDALAERHLADREGRAGAAAVHADHHALEHLDALLVAFAHLDVDAHGVARLDRRALVSCARSTVSTAVITTAPFCSLLQQILQQPAVVLVELRARCQQIRPALQRPRAAPRAAAIARSRRGAPTAAPAAPPCPRNSAGRVYCGKSSSPARERVARHRRLVADDAGHQPRHRVDHHQRRQLAARQHVVADRHLLGRQRLPHALVHAFVPAAQHARRGPSALSRSASACVNRRRPATSGSPRSGVAARRRESRSTARNSGSGFSTIPGPPPNGMSSTTRCRSVV